MTRTRSLWTAIAFAFVLCFPLTLFAQWDPERIAEVKGNAETAYEQKDYPEAARHYIELRGMLKQAIDSGDVPAELLVTAQGALYAISYQLGRSNQLGDNCEGAESVYRELLNDDGTDVGLKARARHRLAETVVCMLDAQIAATDFDAAATLLTTANQELAILDSQLEEDGLAKDLSDELKSEAMALKQVLEASETRAVDTIQVEIERALERNQCDSARRSFDLAAARFNANQRSDWSSVKKNVEDCSKAVAQTEPIPKPVVDGDDDFNIYPWIITGVGGAVLISAVILDAITDTDIDDYELLLDTCRAGVRQRCVDAQERYDTIQTRQTVVLSLYVTGGVILAGGLIWGIIDLTSGEEPSDTTVGVAPTSDGFVSSVRWRF